MSDFPLYRLILSETCLGTHSLSCLSMKDFIAHCPFMSSFEKQKKLWRC